MIVVYKKIAPHTFRCGAFTFVKTTPAATAKTEAKDQLFVAVVDTSGGRRGRAGPNTHSSWPRFFSRKRTVLHCHVCVFSSAGINLVGRPSSPCQKISITDHPQELFTFDLVTLPKSHN